MHAGEDGKGVIYGAEFETQSYNLFETTNSSPHTLADSDVQCAVCRSKARTSEVSSEVYILNNIARMLKGNIL